MLQNFVVSLLGDPELVDCMKEALSGKTQRKIDNVVGDGTQAGSSAELPDFAALKERGVRAEAVMEMNCDELGELIAAYLINFQGNRGERFLDTRKSVTTALEKQNISGGLLVGEERVVDVDEFVSLVLEQLVSDNFSTSFTKRQLEKFAAKFMD